MSAVSRGPQKKGEEPLWTEKNEGEDVELRRTGRFVCKILDLTGDSDQIFIDDPFEQVKHDM